MGKENVKVWSLAQFPPFFFYKGGNNIFIAVFGSVGRIPPPKIGSRSCSPADSDADHPAVPGREPAGRAAAVG